MTRKLSAASPVRTHKPFEPVVRERVLERLASAAAYRIVVVSAPAGFGKSVAIRQYLGEDRPDCVRCDVRREHGTLLGFLGAIAVALERVAPNMQHAYSNLYENAERLPAIVPGIAQWVATSLRSFRGTIVVDDLHHVRDDPRVVELLTELVERTDANVRWIFATRDSLELPIASWLAYGLADVPISESDLRLTIDEAEAAARACDVSLTADSLRELLTLTDGWATAFAFALRASTRNSELAIVARGTREMIYGFLAEQVYRRLADVDRDFLLRTAPLPGLDLRVLRESDLADSRGTIERLRHTTAFVTEESPDVYRYHDLFRDFVEYELRKDDARYAQACNDAASWLERSGNLSGALRLYGDARNHAALVAILESQGAQLFDRGEITLLESVLESLPREITEASPMVLTLEAMIAALRWRLSPSDQKFVRALSICSNTDTRAHIAMRFGATLCWRWRPVETLALLSEIDPSCIHSISLQSRFIAFKAYSLSLVQDQSATDLADEARSSICEDSDAIVQATVLQYAALVEMNVLRFDRSTEFGLAALRLAEDNKCFGLAGRICMMLASIAGEVGDNQTSLWHIARMRQNAEQIGDRVAIDCASVMAYTVYTEQGDIDQISEIESTLSGDASFGLSLDKWPILMPAIAMQHAWSGNFCEALATIIDSEEYAFGMPDVIWRTALRSAEIAMYAAAADEEEISRNALYRMLTWRSRLRDSGYETHTGLKTELFGCLAAIILREPVVASDLIGSVERDLHKANAATSALTRAIRALFVFIEMNSNDDTLLRALDELKTTSYAGFARLIESLKVPAGSCKVKARV